MSQTVHRVTLIPGDGTGPEISEATRRVLEGTGVKFDWDVQHAGVDVMEEHGTPLPDQVLDAPKRGFRPPLAQWFRGDLDDFAREVLLDPRTGAPARPDPERLGAQGHPGGAVGSAIARTRTVRIPSGARAEGRVRHVVAPREEDEVRKS